MTVAGSSEPAVRNSRLCDVSVVVPTFNEEVNLEPCLASVVGWAEQVFVLDSESTDQTRTIAERAGATVVVHPFEGYARQKNWALDNLSIRGGWVLFLDADERVTPELRDEISRALESSRATCDGYFLNRKFIFYGKWIRHCGWFPSWNLRLIRKGRGRYENREVHEHVVVEGSVEYLRSCLIHEDRRDLSHWIAKHNSYSDLEAKAHLRVVEEGAFSQGIGSVTRDAVAFKRWIKERVWHRLPARGILMFLYMYVFRLGFLDGAAGFRFCIWHGIFQHFYASKIWEARRFKTGAPPGGIAIPKSTARASEARVPSTTAGA